jgi:enoyl-CoA hydratase/carnithine racemase
MRHLASEDVIRELTYTGRIISGLEAQAMGLATRVCAAPRAEALTVARAIAAQSPDAVRAAKRLFNAAPYHGLAEGLALESFEQTRLLGSANQREAVTARLQKRAPNFSD